MIIKPALPIVAGLVAMLLPVVADVIAMLLPVIADLLAVLEPLIAVLLTVLLAVVAILKPVVAGLLTVLLSFLAILWPLLAVLLAVLLSVLAILEPVIAVLYPILTQRVARGQLFRPAFCEPVVERVPPILDRGIGGELAGSRALVAQTRQRGCRTIAEAVGQTPTERSPCAKRGTCTEGRQG
jgi:hypothetical protein